MKKITKKGAWIMVIEPILTSIVIPPLTIFFAKPHSIMKESRIWEIGTNAESQNVKVKTIHGDVVLHEQEYNIINIEDFLPYVGKCLEMITLDTRTTNTVSERIFYFQSRGIPKVEAIKLLANTNDFSGFCYFRFNNEYQRQLFNNERLQTIWNLEIEQSKMFPDYLNNRKKELGKQSKIKPLNIKTT